MDMEAIRYAVTSRIAAVGARLMPSLEAYGGLRTSAVHGQYFDAAVNGRLYHSYVQAVTVAATHNSPIAANTATPVLGLGNPVASGKAIVLKRVAVGTTSGTPAGGQCVINTQANAMLTNTAAATGNIFSSIVRADASPQGSAMRPLNNVALGGWLATNGTLCAHTLVGGATAAAAAGNGGINTTGEDLGGSIVVPPGGLVALMCGTGAGTSWIVNAAWSWEEIEWPL